MNIVFNYEAINPENFNPRIFYVIKEEVPEETITYTGFECVTMIYLLSGTCRYIINGIDYVAKKGDIVIINPHSTHKKFPFPGEPVYEFNIGFVGLCVNNLPKNCLIAENSTPIIRLTKYHSQFEQCCYEILDEGMRGEKGSGLILKSVAMKLIALFLKERYDGDLISEALPMKFKSADKQVIVQTIIKFMNENYMKDITLDTISKNMYFSSVYISKIFKDETGEPPINHLIRIRLSKAKQLLETHPISIKSAAELVGYHDAYYFSKLFKKYYGFSPSSIMYKKNKKKMEADRLATLEAKKQFNS